MRPICFSLHWYSSIETGLAKKPCAYGNKGYGKVSPSQDDYPFLFPAPPALPPPRGEGGIRLPPIPCPSPTAGRRESESSHPLPFPHRGEKGNQVGASPPRPLWERGQGGAGHNVVGFVAYGRAPLHRHTPYGGRQRR